VGYIAIIVAFAATLILALRRDEPTQVGDASQPQREAKGRNAAVAEIDREIAFSAIQRISINQRRLVDSTEAKLGVLALAILACFIALVVETESKTLEHVEVVILGVDSLAVLLGLLGFKHREPFDVPIFVRGYKAQAPKNVDEAIDAMADRYVRNEKLHAIKDGILMWTTIVFAVVIALDLTRRYGAFASLKVFGGWVVHGLVGCPWVV
jgi:hypothetical protein